ncbi:MAG: hypothetical protein CVU53_07370, partial [Deltaproteobacteria bacterium HGW-Deltaproteobacteria-11]
RRFDPALSMNADSGYSSRHLTDICRHCGTCARICHFGAIQVNDSSWTYDRKTCMGCGLCTEHCPEQALSLYRDKEKTHPLDLDLIKAERLTMAKQESANGI